VREGADRNYRHAKRRRENDREASFLPPLSGRAVIERGEGRKREGSERK
jgi:hypothetical protein